MPAFLCGTMPPSRFGEHRALGPTGKSVNNEAIAERWERRLCGATGIRWLGESASEQSKVYGTDMGE